MNSSCEKLGFVNPAETINGILSLNNNEVPPGTCRIIKNELKRMNDLIGNYDDPQVSCTSFSAANVKLSDSDGKKTFIFNNGIQTYQASWNSETSEPDLRTVKIFGPDGQENRNMTLAFTEKYNFMHPPSFAEKYPVARDMASSCSNDAVALDCKLINAIVKAKIYSGISNRMCDEASPGAANTQTNPGVAK